MEDFQKVKKKLSNKMNLIWVLVLIWLWIARACAKRLSNLTKESRKVKEKGQKRIQESNGSNIER